MTKLIRKSKLLFSILTLATLCFSFLVHAESLSVACSEHAQCGNMVIPYNTEDSDNPSLGSVEGCFAGSCNVRDLCTSSDECRSGTVCDLSSPFEYEGRDFGHCEGHRVHDESQLCVSDDMCGLYLCDVSSIPLCADGDAECQTQQRATCGARACLDVEDCESGATCTSFRCVLPHQASFLDAIEVDAEKAEKLAKDRNGGCQQSDTTSIAFIFIFLRVIATRKKHKHKV